MFFVLYLQCVQRENVHNWSPKLKPSSLDFTKIKAFGNKFLLLSAFINLSWVMCGPTQNLGPIGWAVLTFIGYKQTHRKTKSLQDILTFINKKLKIIRFSGHKKIFSHGHIKSLRYRRDSDTLLYKYRVLCRYSARVFISKFCTCPQLVEQMQENGEYFVQNMFATKINIT